MDSLSFMKSISYYDFIEAIKEHFEENMALFNLLKDTRRTDMRAITGYPNSSSISFNIEFQSEPQADVSIRNLLAIPVLYMYGNRYDITVINYPEVLSIVVTMTRAYDKE